MTKYVILRNSVDQAIPNSALTALTWDRQDVDTDDLHSSSANTDLITLPPGLWLIIAVVAWQANATGYREIRLSDVTNNFDIAFESRSSVSVNTAERLSLAIIWAVPGAGSATSTPTSTTGLVSYRVNVFQSSGASLNVLGVRSSYLMAVQLA